jgi:SRSO17 transposase
MYFKLRVNHLYHSLHEVTNFHNNFASHFRTKTRSVEKQSSQYLQGIFLEKGKGNMVNYAKNVPDCNNQSLQHFVSNSPWDERPVIDHIQRDVSSLIGDQVNGSIHIDESGFPKSGKNSVGVKRQYCGRLGKVDLCQVGVFLGYVNGSYRTIIDEALYLPKDWIEDPKRRETCGVPEDVVFKTKAELGLDLILHARENGVPFGWVGMDSFYGEQPWLLDRIDTEGLVYIADIPCDTRVWLDRPKTRIPERKGDRGRTPTKEKILEDEPRSVEVRDLAEKLDTSQWNHRYVRDTERKKLWTNIACIRVYPVVDKLPGDELWLIIRKDDGENLIKYQFSNAPFDTNVSRLTQMSYSRYWIERAFQDAKGIAGLTDYQIRNWMGWHHHITISLLAMLLILKLTLDLGKKADFLTVQDVKEILEVILPKREIDWGEILHILEEKHKARESARRSHHNRNK